MTTATTNRPTNNRSQELRAAVAELLAVHDRWAEDRHRPNPDGEYWDAVNSLLDTFDGDAVPEDCHNLADAAERVDSAAKKFDDRENQDNLYPPDEFWSAIQILREALHAKPEAPKFPPLESISALVNQKVSLQTIAKIYGLYDAAGHPDVAAVEKELREPGSVIDDQWIDPRLKEWEEQRSNKAARMQRRAKEQAVEEETKSPPAPESPHDLWKQKVEPWQAAKMLKISEEEAKKLFAEFDEEAKPKSSAASTVEKKIGKKQK